MFETARFDLDSSIKLERMILTGVALSLIVLIEKEQDETLPPLWRKLERSSIPGGLLCKAYMIRQKYFPSKILIFV